MTVIVDLKRLTSFARSVWNTSTGNTQRVENDEQPYLYARASYDDSFYVAPTTFRYSVKGYQKKEIKAKFCRSKINR